MEFPNDQLYPPRYQDSYVLPSKFATAAIIGFTVFAQ